MSRASMNTGGAIFSVAATESHLRRAFSNPDKRLKVAILGDFSGRNSRREVTPENIVRRASHVINKDNFEQVFTRFNIRLQLPFCDLPISFTEFDDLHPDYLYSRVSLFQQFIDLNNKLLDPKQFEQAAREIQHWQAHNPDSATDSKGSPSSSSEELLESILSNLNERTAARTPIDEGINALINRIVAPHIRQSDLLAPEDPRQADLLEAVNQATSQAMRSIMHHSDYQQLEASWRSVQLLLRRLEESSNIDIHLIDLSKEELLADLRQADDDLEQAQIFHRLVTSQTAESDDPYNLILGDFYLQQSDEDLGLIIDMGTIAESTGSCFICGAHSILAGFPSLAGPVEPREWQYPLQADFVSGLQAVQDYSASQHVIAASPRFMLRLPYGKQTSTTDCFEFEELVTDNRHRYYLWGNSGYLVTLLLCQAFLQGEEDVNCLLGSCIENLALHHYRDHSETHIKPCAETLLTDTAAHAFRQRGLCCVRSVQQQDKVMIAQINSMHFSGEVKTPWS